MPDNAIPVPLHLALAIKALRRPELLALAPCLSKENGTLVTTLCLRNEKTGRLRPFAIVPALDLRESLHPPRITIETVVVTPTPTPPTDPRLN